MPQDYHTHNRPKHQIQTPSMSSTYAYILDEGGGSNSPSQSMLTNDMDDDDDICPVCESECTCANRTRNITQVTSPPPSQNYQNGYAPLAAPKINDSYASVHSLGHPSLKIKLTLPSKAQPRAGSSTNGKSVNVRAPTFKKKSKSVSETTFAGGSVDGDDTSPADVFFTLGQSSVSSGSAGGYLNADGSIPKKRGRPTKAVVAAREAAKVGTGARYAGAGIGLSMDNVGLVRHAKQMSSRKTALPKSGGAKKKGKKLHGAAAASRAKAQLRRAQQQQLGLPQQQKKRRQAVVEDYESSELSELNDDEDEGDDMHAFGLPTFISAFSSSSNGSSSDSDSDSETETDKETHFQHPKSAENPFKEAIEHAQRKREHRDWEIYVRKRSVGVNESSDADMGVDSDDENEADEEEEEEEEEEEGDEGDEDEDANGPGVQRLMRYAGVATGWTDDEEDSFDADLFFANLSDSTADGSDNDEMENAEDGSGQDDGNHEEEMDVEDGGFNSGFDVMRLSEVAAAGFLAPFVGLERSGVENLPFGQGWDHLLLSNSLKDSLLDFGVSHLNRDAPFGQALDFAIPGFEDADAMMATSEEEEAVAMFDNDDLQDPEEEDGVEIFEDSDGGDTTEDEYVDVDGIATPRNMVLLRFPASLGAIDPMSTVSSPVQGRDERGRTLSAFSSLSKNRDSHRPTPRPGDILSGKVLSGNKENVDTSLVRTSTAGILNAPMMGSFAPETSNKTKRVVIADTGNSPARESVPCPYPAIRRLRRRADSLGMLSHNSDRCSGTSRRSSLLGSSRSPYEAMVSGFESTDDAEFQLAEPIKLDDVLDTALLESQPSDNPLPELTASETGESDTERDKHLQNLQRWDHIPIDAFRKTRVAGTVGDLTLDVDKMGAVPPTPRAPRPADGFSYGSAVGGMLRGSPLNTSFWESGSGSGMPRSGARKTTLRGGRLGRMPVVISPVILPVRDGDSTPTNERHHHHHHQQQHAYLGFSGQHAAHAHAQNIKSRKELRKEKKRNRNFFGPSAASVRQHFPNSKNRSSSGMQRSNHGSSSIPSLSI